MKKENDTFKITFNELKRTFNDRVEYYNSEGFLHRENDLPARIYENGTKSWWINGKRHRENGPAVIDAYGQMWWFLNDVKIEEKNYEDELIKLKLKRLIEK
jgi:hypothetical protein